LAGTQTRAAFVSLVACVLVALLQGIGRSKHLGHTGISRARVLLIFAVIAGLLSWSSIQFLSDRIDSENTTIQVLLTGNLEELPFTSIGIRIHSWAESLKWIAERPVTGWGRHARADVIRLAEGFPADIRSTYGHLHNGFLEILVGFGAVGFIYLCVLWGVVLVRIKRTADRDLYAFALYGSVFFLAFNLFESFLIKSSGVFSVSLFMAAGYSQYLATTLSARPRSE
jgi:O-antigen ligase